MYILPTGVKRNLWKVIALTYVMSSLWWGPAAEAAFHLERADGELPAKGILVAEPVRGLVTCCDEDISFLFPKPKPRPAPVVVQGTRANGSANRFVNPWGCEARHAQQWSPSKRYWGKYQFDRQTWQAHGGKASEYGSAPESRQDQVASQVRYDAWPNC